ncbi:MAG: hypothetical protein HYV77_00450, partial [Candidatus Wildermuthbacteria bacterium]|nr:hypothetical protein [Candidatus Wildermuthbacteria bacterium]
MPKRRRGPEDQGGDRGQTKDLKDLRELDAFVGEFPPATENPGDDPGRENPREAGDKDVDRVVDAVVESNGGEGVAENEIDRRIGVAANELLMQKGKPRYSQAQAETWMRGMSERQRIEFARRMRNILEQKPVVPKREPASPPKKVEKRDDVAEGGAKGMRRLESDAVNAYYQKKLAGGTQEELDAILAQFGGQGVASAVLNTIPGRVDRLIVPA